MSDVNRWKQDGIRADFSPIPDENPRGRFGTLDRQICLAIEHFVLRDAVLIERSNITPILLHGVAIDLASACENLGEDIAGPVVGFAILHEVEDARLEDIHPGVNRVRKDLTPAWLLEETLNFAIRFCEDNAKLQWIWDALEHDGCFGAGRPVGCEGFFNIDVG